ncbi:hypothetical protein N8996_04080 [Candidatus Poseidonia alphae]|nr:hypothetical protein [Candidatus Poseidonia alphae]
MNIFTLPDEDEVLSDKLNLDDLFEKKREISETKLGLYNKVLNRIHHKIKLTSRNNFGKDQWCWYLIPEVMIGVARYNVDECIGYIIQKLKNNEFAIRYTNPNLIFISWQHWVPGYVRQEFKKQTGKVIDGFGNYVSNDGDEKQERPKDNNTLLLNNKHLTIENKKQQNEKDFNSVKNYKPSGIYNIDLIEKIQEKLQPK